MAPRWMTLCAMFAAAAACRANEPTASAIKKVSAVGTPTVLVVNATCQPGPCVSFELRAFIPKFAVPGQLPTGWLDIGQVNTASACLKLPAADTLTVIGHDSTGAAVDTTRMVWTVQDPLTLIAATSPMTALGTSAEFTPASSAGWSVTFPSGPVASAVLPSTACAQ